MLRQGIFIETEDAIEGGRFSFMLVVYGRLFSGVVSIRLEREEIERQIPEKYRTHKFQANSVAHWTEVSWKYDPLKQLVYPSIHYEVRCGLDGTVKWFVVGRFPPLHSLFSLLAHLLSTELCPMPFLRFLLPFLRFWQGVSHQIPVICTGSNPIHSNALTSPLALFCGIFEAVVATLQPLMQPLDNVVPKGFQGAQTIDEVSDVIDEDMKVGGNLFSKESLCVEVSELKSFFLPSL
jgi:hypothetical protein